MVQILDGELSWIVQTVVGITNQHVKVTMAGENGFAAVTSGPARAGEADVDGNLYSISLPGVRAGGFDVEFGRS